MIRLKKILLEDDMKTKCWTRAHPILIDAIEYWLARIGSPEFLKQFIKAHGGEKLAPDINTNRNQPMTTRVDKSNFPEPISIISKKPSSNKLPGITYFNALDRINQYKKILNQYKAKSKFKITSGYTNTSANRSLGMAWYSPGWKTITLNCRPLYQYNDAELKRVFIHELTHALFDEGGPLNPTQSWQKFSDQIEIEQFRDKSKKPGERKSNYRHIEYNDSVLKARFPKMWIYVRDIINSYNYLDDPKSFHYTFFKKYSGKDDHDYSKQQSEMIARLAEIMEYLGKSPGDLLTVNDFENLLKSWKKEKFFFYGWVSSYPNIPTIPETVNALNGLVVKNLQNKSSIDNIKPDEIT